MMRSKALLMVIAALAPVLLGCNAQRWASEATETAYQETRPIALITKYRKFKAMASQLDAMQANILTGQAGLKRWETTYGKDFTKWPRDVRERRDEKESDLDIRKQAFNSLAADYNAAMADFATSFCNVGQMPKGFPEDCQSALKRSYAAYEVN